MTSCCGNAKCGKRPKQYDATFGPVLWPCLQVKMKQLLKYKEEISRKKATKGFEERTYERKKERFSANREKNWSLF